MTSCHLLPQRALSFSHFVEVAAVPQRAVSDAVAPPKGWLWHSSRESHGDPVAQGNHVTLKRLHSYMSMVKKAAETD